MDSVLSTNSAPPGYYRQLDKMVKAAANAHLDYTQKMRECNRDGRATLDLEQFQTVVKSMDPFIGKPELDLLLQNLRDPTVDRAAVNIVIFSRELDKLAQNTKTLEKFFKAVRQEMNNKGLTIEQFFQNISNSRTQSMAPSDLDKCLKEIKFDQPPEVAKLLFTSLNEFESDFKVSQQQFVKVYEEYNSKHSTGLQPTTSNPLAMNDDTIEKIAPELLKLKEGMFQKGIDRLKIHLQKTCKVDQGHITSAEFESVLRDILPNLTFRECRQLVETIAKEGKVNIDTPDEFLRESSRFSPNSKSRLEL